eukprot:1239244-Rhodomonas_salina.2
MALSLLSLFTATVHASLLHTSPLHTPALLCLLLQAHSVELQARFKLLCDGAGVQGARVDEGGWEAPPTALTPCQPLCTTQQSTCTAHCPLPSGSTPVPLSQLHTYSASACRSGGGG